ncbi:MAG TPA: hypothetical protein VK584_12475, partial [Streptosporangiaceae bacterium]|nr:hypothetical protein [Streptosporangiaceae bacterium]
LRMDPNAYRDDNDTDQPDASQPDAYWRRRVITLCAGLVLLGLLAWAFSGGGGKQAAAKKAAQASGALPAIAYSGTPASGAAASAAVNGAPGSGAPASPSPGADASASVGSSASLPFLTASPPPGASTPGASASARAARGAAASANATAGPAGGVEPGGGCAPNAIVLSVFTSRTSYHAGQYPVFEVYAVSTASRACTFNLSPAKLHVLVSSSGRVIWDSADCTRGQPKRLAELRRGVPAQESLSWNRTISLPGCVTVASSARPGTYQVRARDASVASPVRTFKLAR